MSLSSLPKFFSSLFFSLHIKHIKKKQFSVTIIKMNLLQKLVFLLQNRFRMADSTKMTLGRWSIDYCGKKLNKKIDLSNEDHCGPCGQYILNQQNTIKFQDQLKIIDLPKR